VAGVALIILGALALGTAMFTTMLSVMVLGVLFAAAACVQFGYAFTSGKLSGFGLHLLLAALYGIAGASMIMYPATGAASVTMLLGFLFVTSGVFRVVASAGIRFPSWGWSAFSGVVTTCLGLYVLNHLAAASFVLLGTILGVDLIFLGINLTALGGTVRRIGQERSAYY
jgi:uncharacterized membrane protein HdeD (DUF308 family)